MTPYPSRSNRSQKLSAPLAAFALLFLAACSDKHIGRPCDPYNTAMSDASVDPTSAIVNTETLECPSRICLLPAQAVTTKTGPFCTDECGSDDDCSGGETGNANDPNDPRCKAGFFCSYVVPKLPDQSTPLQCKKLCVCKDFQSKPNPLPEGC